MKLNRKRWENSSSVTLSPQAVLPFPTQCICFLKYGSSEMRLIEISIAIISEDFILHNSQWKLSLGKSRQSLCRWWERRFPYTVHAIPLLRTLCMLFLVYLVTSPFHDICPRFRLVIQRVKNPELWKRDSCLTVLYKTVIIYDRSPLRESLTGPICLLSFLCH